MGKENIPLAFNAFEHLDKCLSYLQCQYVLIIFNAYKNDRVVKLLPCNRVVTGSSLGSSLFQECKIRFAYNTPLWWDPSLERCSRGRFVHLRPSRSFLRHLLLSLQTAMAASNAIQGMYDVALKPKLLRLLLRDYVPDDKHPFPNPSDLSRVVTAVKTHRLLSERAPHSVDQKLIDSWKSAVDAWLNRLTSLISSNMPDKIWAAICLMGLTCQECSFERFSASYTEWFGVIFSHIQTFSDSHFVRVASCASMSDLFTRLGGFPISKKDGTSLATKLVQPVLKLISEDASDFVLEEAICLLCTLINFFPSSVSRHYVNVEASIFLRLMSENGSIVLCKKLGHCLAMLPKAKGDEDSWSLMMQKVLLFLNDQLTLAFQGLEKDTIGNEVFSLLVPPGKDRPPPLGGASAKHSDLAMKRPEQVLVSRVSILMFLCSTMLASSYPVQVSVPIRPLIAFTKRVLMVDGSLSPSTFMMVMRHEFMCSELPALHICSLDLLSAIIKGLRSQLLPHVADITQLLTEYFRSCALPELRIKVYSVVKVLLLSMGIGIAMYLIEVVIDNAFVDLDSSGHEKSGTYSGAYSKASGPSHKKRKHAASTGCVEEESPSGGMDVGRSQNLTPISVRIAALEALEALLTMAGALRSDNWRSKVDDLLLRVATNACKWGLIDDKSTKFYDEAASVRKDLQLAALRALLASLLSPGRVRPPHLAHSLELFRNGSQETGTKISTFCSHALLTLEVLIHPRALPLVDFQSSVDDYDGSLKLRHTYLGNHRKNSLFQIGTQGKQPSQTHYNDDLYESWIAKGGTGVGSDEEPSGTSGNVTVDKRLPGVLPSGIEAGDLGPLMAVTTDVVAVDKDKMMVESMTEEKYKHPEEFDRVDDLLVATDVHIAAELNRLVSCSVKSHNKELVAEAPERKDYAFDSNTDKTLVEKIEAPASARDESRGGGCDVIVEKISASLENAEKTYAEKGKGVAVEVDDDYIPDIVDGDPDSE